MLERGRERAGKEVVLSQHDALVSGKHSLAWLLARAAKKYTIFNFDAALVGHKIRLT